MFKVLSNHSYSNPGSASGFTLIELMIVVAIIAIILTLALPVYSNYAVRAKVGEALSVGAGAKTAVATTCVENPISPALTNGVAGYGFQPGPFVASIVITTQLTGASPDPVLTLLGSLLPGSSQLTWTCTTNGPNIYVPKSCRS
jgi:type IV pilus assembly protein PilA